MKDTVDHKETLPNEKQPGKDRLKSDRVEDKPAHKKQRNTVAIKEDRTVKRAMEYENKFKTGSRRNQRLDRFEKAFARHVFQMAGNDPHILDIPCGSGRFFEIFSAAQKLTMADYSSNMLKTCKERYGSAENLELIEGEISSLPLPDNSADLCFCMRLFHHMKTDEVRLGALKELARISRKYVALSFFNQNCLRFYWRKILGKNPRGHHIRYQHFINLAKQAGLEPVESFPKVNIIGQQCLVVFRKM